MNTLMTWIDERTGLVSGMQRLCDRKVPAGSGLCLMPLLAPMIVFCVVTQAITGFFLWSYYSPSAQTAWESVYFIQHELAGGWLIRGIHHYSAQLLVFLLLVYILRVVFGGRYRAPREFVFWIAVAMGLLGLGACLTGDLLAWTSYGYSSTLVRTKFLLLLPVIGDDLFKIAIGGPGPGLDSFTLTRFLALHIGVMGGGMIVLTVLWRLADAKAGATLLDGGAKATWYWPNRAAWDMTAWVLALAIILLLVLPHHGVALKAPADTDPAAFDGTARPEWSFRALYGLSHLSIFAGSWQIIPIFFISTGLVLYFFAIPLIAKIKMGPMVRFPAGHLVNMVVVGLITLTGVYLTWHSYHTDAHDEEYQEAFEESQRLAERTIELCQRPEGIPPEGALSLLLNDPKAQGPRLFKDYCASCHSAAGYEVETLGSDTVPTPDPVTTTYERVTYKGGIVSETPTAPNLHGIGSREWIAGWFDPEKIAGPEYFGNSPFAEGSMVKFVQSDLNVAKAGMGEMALFDLVDAIAADLARATPEMSDAELQQLLDFVAANQSELSTAMGPGEFEQMMDVVAAALNEAELDDPDAMDDLADRLSVDLEYLIPLLGESEFEKLIDLLAEEAKLDSPREFNNSAVEGLTEEDLFRVADFGCTGCHVFYNDGSAQGPELSGYCSREWLIDIVKDPGEKRFYGDTSGDKMPAYHKSEEDAQLAVRQIELLVDWMQGRWYEPAAASESR